MIDLNAALDQQLLNIPDRTGCSAGISATTITSGGNRNPANAAFGGSHGRERLNEFIAQACLDHANTQRNRTPRVNTQAAIAARRAHVRHLLDAVCAAARRMDRDGTRVTVRGVASLAGVSRTFLYQNPDARRLVDDATAAHCERRRARRHTEYTSAQQEASWRERDLNTEEHLRRAHGEIRTLRTRPIAWCAADFDKLIT